MRRVISKLKLIFVSFLFLSIVLSRTGQTFADVSPISLEQLTRICTRAVLAKVTRIIDVEGAKIAESKILMTLKGAPAATDRLYFPAEPISTEDTSHAVVGETLLLFVEPEPAEVNESAPFRTKLREAIGNEQLWLITWSGRGRLPIIRIGQTDYVKVLADPKLAQVRFPSNMSTVPLAGSGGRVQLVELDDVVRFIKRKARRDRMVH